MSEARACVGALSRSRLLATTGVLLTLAVRSRPGLVRVVRSMGAELLDQHFDYQSPLPAIERSTCDHSLTDPVLLPPLGALREGNQDVRGLMHLVSLARTVGARTVFEFGTYNGLTAWVLAKNLPRATVHTLDIPPEESPTLRLIGADVANLSHFARDRAYTGTSENSRIVQHLGDSARFDVLPFRGSCDLVYIDGAHSFEYVKSDTEAALRMVAPHGVIVWDDYWRRVPDVPRYLHTRGDLPLVRLPSSRLVACFVKDLAIPEAPQAVTG